MFQVGDKIVYPMHGAGVIEAIEEREVLGTKQVYYVMGLRNMQVMFPMRANSGIRQIVASDILEDVLTLFNSKDAEHIFNPSQRQRSNINKIKTGDIYEVAQVIRDLVHLGKQKSLSTGDKNMLDNARNIFLSELMLVKGINQQEGSELLDKVINT